MSNTDKLSNVEHIKLESNYLRGTIQESLADELSGGIADDDTQLTKFHGFYQQDDRDLRSERKHSKLEPHYQFMVRMRLPAGTLTPQQWRACDNIARDHGNDTLRITTRQTFQFHGVLKHHLKPLMQELDAVDLDAKGGCGDDNRNVQTNTNPHESALHQTVHDWSKSISERLLWRSRAYDELWLDAAPSDQPDHEPLYGPSYLPRKFKVAIAIPPENDADVFANDIGLIAIVDDNELLGFNVAVGGGMGMTHGETATYPRLASVIGFATPDQILDTVETLVTIQRDYGDRENRKHARFKYTIDDHGLDWVHQQLAERADITLGEAREYHFDRNGDPLGWRRVEDADGNARWHVTLFVENGRIADFDDGRRLKSGFRQLAEIHDGEFRLTCNHNVIVANIPDDRCADIERVISDYGMDDGSKLSRLRHSAMSCVAFPTCGLAMAESERYLPRLIDKIQAVQEDAGIGDNAIVIRMTGCPNGCARPYNAEIGFVGKAIGKYNVYLGGAWNGERLNKLYRENIDEDEILAELTPLITRYASERHDGESFGDFVIRTGIIAETHAGLDFHAQTETA